MGDSPYENGVVNSEENGNIGNVKNISNVIKNVSGTSEDYNEGYSEGYTGNYSDGYNGQNASVYGGADFRVTKASSNLPEKTSFWTKIKNALFYEIKIELTPYQQKIEDEINDFLHQEITWKSLKEAALSEVPITFKGKRIF